MMVRPTPRAQQFKVVRRLNSIDSDNLIDAIQRSVIVDNIVHLVDYTVADLCRLHQSELRKLLGKIAPPIFKLNRYKSPWFDGECSTIHRQARALERCYRQSRLPTDLVAWSASLEEKRTLFTLKEKTYWSRKLEGCSDNSTQLWCCLNSILMRDVTPSTGDSSLPAQSLSDFFQEKVHKICAATQSCPPATFSGPCLTRFNEFQPCSAEEIRRIIQQSPAKSCALDPLPHSLLIKSLDHIMPILTLICNNSMLQGVVPDCEKSTVIVPIVKKLGLDPDCMSSYRPVSNLTFLSKLVECLVCGQLMAYLQDNHHLVPQQSSYCRHHSTETAMLKIASNVFDVAYAGHVTILALLDLSAAFDTVDHVILLQRLNHTYGIGGTVLHWVRSFLSGQVQVVHFAGQHSKESPLLCGLPQGSVSGPILFSLYTADVVRITQSFGVCIHCYADDLQLYVYCHVEDAESPLRACLRALVL